MPDKLFLETYPLYRKFTLSFHGLLGFQPVPPINFYCMQCESIQTFRGGWNTRAEDRTAAGTVAHLAYACVACKRYTHNFLIHFADTQDSVTKVGQFPPWDIVPDPALDRLAGDYAPILRRGLICESQGYGIGAFAYYRRIVEHVIGALLDDIGALIPPEEAATYGRALAAAKATIVAKDKIFLVKDLLPASLRPDGLNPLGILHETLSEGLHEASEDSCLALAAEVRESLAFLASQVAEARTRSRTFTDSMRRLLDRKRPKDA